MLLRIPNIHNSIKEKVFRFVRSKMLTNDLEAIVTSGASGEGGRGGERGGGGREGGGVG